MVRSFSFSFSKPSHRLEEKSIKVLRGEKREGPRRVLREINEGSIGFISGKWSRTPPSRKHMFFPLIRWEKHVLG